MYWLHVVSNIRSVVIPVSGVHFLESLDFLEAFAFMHDSFSFFCSELAFKFFRSHVSNTFYLKKIFHWFWIDSYCQLSVTLDKHLPLYVYLFYQTNGPFTDCITTIDRSVRATQSASINCSKRHENYWYMVLFLIWTASAVIFWIAIVYLAKRNPWRYIYLWHLYHL